MIIAAELGTPIRVTSGPAIERAGDLAALLTSLGEGEVLFIDEIHRIARPAEELLYMAMEDFRVDVIVGKGPGATAIPLELAAVHPRRRHHPGRPAHRPAARPVRLHRAHGLLRRARARARCWSARPSCSRVDLRDRTAPPRSPSRSRGTPRIANRLLRRVRDYAEVRADGVVTEQIARDALAVYDVDELGLDRLDRAVLDALVRRFGGGPVGVGTLAVAVGEEVETVEEVAEPFLVRAGLLARTPRGRVATPAAWGHLGLTAPPTAERGRPCSTRRARHARTCVELRNASFAGAADPE